VIQHLCDNKLLLDIVGGTYEYTVYVDVDNVDKPAAFLILCNEVEDCRVPHALFIHIMPWKIGKTCLKTENK